MENWKLLDFGPIPLCGRAGSSQPRFFACRREGSKGGIEVETGIKCFAAGTLLLTPAGPRAMPNAGWATGRTAMSQEPYAGGPNSIPDYRCPARPHADSCEKE
jgi:hypothetical protein